MTDTWTFKSNFIGDSAGRSGIAIGTDTKGYAGFGQISDTFDPGGQLYSKKWWEYDPSTDTWVQKATLDAAYKYWMDSFYVNDCVYIGNGRSDFGQYRDWYKYDIITNTWSTPSMYPTFTMGYGVGFNINDKGYAGIPGTVWCEYDPQADTWTAKSHACGVEKKYCAGFSIGDKGYIGSGSFQDDFWEYDPVTNIWTQIQSGGSCQFAIGFSIGENGYVSSDMGFWEWNSLTNIWTQKQTAINHSPNYSKGFTIGLKNYILNFEQLTVAEWCCGTYFNPYNISGISTNALANPNIGITIRVTNETTSEHTDTITDTIGYYAVDLRELPSSFTDGDHVSVRCYSKTENIIIDKTIYPGGQTVNITCNNNKSTIQADISTRVVSNKIRKSLDNMAWQSDVVLENKNGRRTTDYYTGQPITVSKTYGATTVTFLKGEVVDVDTNTKHLLRITGENYTADLNKIYVNDTFTNKSIYYAITDSTNGLIPKYASNLSVSGVVNDVNTQKLFTKTFAKVSISDALTWLGDFASSTGYVYYVDNNKNLDFSERRASTTGLVLTNTGSEKSVLSWNWKNYSGKDIFNRVKIFGDDIEVIRNDIDSQSEFGIREHPPITDIGITTISDAEIIGDNLLTRFSIPYKDVVLKLKTDAMLSESIFPLKFPFEFSGRRGIYELEPGDLVTTNIIGAGVPQSNIFPWKFTTDFTPEDRIILKIEHDLLRYITTIELTEHHKDLVSLLVEGTK